MTLLGQELISSNGISPVALGFFTALFGMLSTLITMHYRDRKEIRDARKASEEAAESAQRAQANTENVSNGFAGSVLAILKRLDERLDAHIEWHLENDRKDKK